MNIYIILAVALSGGLVVWLVSLIKEKAPEDMVRFLPMVIAAAISIGIAYMTHRNDGASYFASTAGIYLLSQLYYHINIVVTKWLAKDKSLTKDEVTTDGENLIAAVKQDLANAANPGVGQN